MSARSDAKLIELCLRGDERAWADLVNRYERLVFSLGRSEGLSRSDAEDLVQSVFLTLVQSLASVRESSQLSLWLRTVSRRTAWRYRDQARRFDRPSSTDIEDHPDSQNDLTDAQVDLVTLEQALAELGDRCEELLVRLYFSDGDCSYASISRELDIPVGSIGPTRARCLDKLRAILEGGSHFDSMTYRAVGITRASRLALKPTEDECDATQRT